LANTYYDIFEISHTASAEEIKLAYRKQALKFHPDRNQDKYFSDSKMKEINFIYSILSNPDKKKWYDSTLSFDGKEQQERNQSYSFSYIFCNELFVKDSKGKNSKLKVGDTIYYLVEIDKSIITWKYKEKEYFDVIVKNIFDPKHKDDFSKAVKFDYNKTPLCTAYWGKSEMIIYKEDFESFWISQESYSILDKQKGLFSAILIICIVVFGGYHFYSKFKLSDVQREKLQSITEQNEKYLEKERKYYKEEYFASDAEFNYINSGYYTVFEKETRIIKNDADILNIPDQLGLVVGEVLEGEKVTVLLYCPSLNRYKIKHKDIVGWIGASRLGKLVYKDK
jgi:curved DNA-binding protein CbpA